MCSAEPNKLIKPLSNNSLEKAKKTSKSLKIRLISSEEKASYDKSYTLFLYNAETCFLLQISKFILLYNENVRHFSFVGKVGT